MENRYQTAPAAATCNESLGSRSARLPTHSAIQVDVIKYLLCLGALFSSISVADPLNQGLSLGTSVADAYDARSIFTHPAALGFQTELNGAALLASFEHSANRGMPNELAAGLSYGYLGLGLESLTTPLGLFQRYQVGLGIPLTPWLFVGGRYGIQRAGRSGNPRFNSTDLGFQLRPHANLSFGFLVNRVFSSASAHMPAQFVTGATFHPHPRVDLSADVDTLSNNFGNKFGAQGTITIEPFSGVFLSGGYHTDCLFHGGLTLNLSRLSIFSRMQPASDARNIVSGIQVSAQPQRSILEPDGVLKLQIKELSEQPAKGGLFRKERPGFISILETLRDAGRDDAIRGVVLELDSFPLGLASAQELFEALASLREKGKDVEVLLGSATLKEYLIASSANRIVLSPSGELRLIGVRSEKYFVKGTLDKLGIEAELLAKGDYKSAPEMFMRRESSEKAKEATAEQLESAEREILLLLGRYRKITAQSWKTLTQTALFSAEDALAAGLIDEIANANERWDRTEHRYAIRTSLRRQRRRLALPSQVGVIVAEGDILNAKNRALSLTGRSLIVPEEMERLLKTAVGDPRIRAIVLRINSGGGEILASHRIASYLEEAKKKKPVVVSMGDAAASGGFFIAAPAHRIFAQPLTLTGSIGVFLGKFNMKGLFERLDLRKETQSRAPYPGLYAEDRPWTAEERKIMVRRRDQYYKLFVDYVSKQRSLKSDEVEKAAQGRVWLGRRASELKLVDETGGLRAAIEFAARSVSLGEDEYDVVAFAEDAGLLPSVASLTMGKSAADELAEVFSQNELFREVARMSQFSSEPFLYFAPTRAME